MIEILSILPIYVVPGRLQPYGLAPLHGLVPLGDDSATVDASPSLFIVPWMIVPSIPELQSPVEAFWVEQPPIS
jgi:hypothetical protein